MPPFMARLGCVESLGHQDPRILHEIRIPQTGILNAPVLKRSGCLSGGNFDRLQSAAPRGGRLPPISGDKFPKAQFTGADDVQQIQCAAARRGCDFRHEFHGFQHDLFPRKPVPGKFSIPDQLGKKFPAETELLGREFAPKDFCMQGVLQLQFDKPRVGNRDPSFL